MSDYLTTEIRPATEPVAHAPAPLDLGLIFAAFLRSLPLAFVIALAAGGISAAVLAQSDPVYEVRTQVAVGSPTDVNLDPMTLETLGPLYSSIANDDGTRASVREQTGITDPDLTASTTSVPGVIEISVRAGSVDQARTISTAALESLEQRSDFLYAEAIRGATETGERSLAEIRQEIAQRQEADPEADVTDLESQLEEVYAQNQGDDIRRIQPLALAQSDNGGDRIWPTVVPTSLVIGMLAFLLAQIPLIIWRLRRHRRADGLWLRLIGHRHGVDGEMTKTDGGLSPLAEARASATLADGGEVLVLGEVEAGDSLDAYDSRRFHQTSWLTPWWRSVPPTELSLGIVVIDKGDRRGNQAATAVERLAESGVPTFVVVREQNSGKKKG